MQHSHLNSSKRTIKWLLILALLFPLPVAAQTSLEPVSLETPTRLTLGPPGQLLVSDARTRTIQVLDIATGEADSSFKIKGTPLAVAWVPSPPSNKGKKDQALILVGNADTSAVEIYKSGGARTGYLGTGPGSVGKPNDIAVDPETGLVYVADTLAQHLKVFRLSDGELVGAIGTGILFHPTAVAFDPTSDEILVSDFGGAYDFNDPTPVIDQPKVKIFATDGTLRREIIGDFDRPQGLAVDGNGHFFLVDSLRGQVLAYEQTVVDQTNGGELKVLGALGTAPGELFLPLDISLHPDSGDLFVTNSNLGRIEVFPAGGIIP